MSEDRKDNFDRLKQHDILAIGSLVVDTSCHLLPENGPVKQGSSNKAKITQCLGGVAHNIALAAKYCGGDVLLASVIGNDSFGVTVLELLSEEELDVNGLIQFTTSVAKTGQYVGNYDESSNFMFGMADVSIMQHDALLESDLWVRLFEKVKPKVVVLDTTFPRRTFKNIKRIAGQSACLLVINPVSIPRAQDLDVEDLKDNVLVCNSDEACAIVDSLGLSPSGTSYNIPRNTLGTEDVVAKPVENAIIASLLLAGHCSAVITTMVTDGAVLALRNVHWDHRMWPQDYEFKTNQWYGLVSIPNITSGYIVRRLVPTPVRVNQIKSPNGAGDTFLGSVLVSLLDITYRTTSQSSCGWVSSLAQASPQDWSNHLDLAQMAAIKTLEHQDAVNSDLKEFYPGMKRAVYGR